MQVLSNMLDVVGKIISIGFKVMLVIFALATWGVVDIVDMIDEI